MRAILSPYWGNLLGVQPQGYNPGTLEFRVEETSLDLFP